MDLTEVPDYFGFCTQKANMEQAFAEKCIREAESRPGPPIVWRHTPLARLPEVVQRRLVDKEFTS